jgi:hypothetical protein
MYISTGVGTKEQENETIKLRVPLLQRSDPDPQEVLLR